MKSKIIKEKYKGKDGLEMQYRYFDKHGIELFAGNFVMLFGRKQKLYSTDDGCLGTDATNPKWLETGRAYECEYGIYALNDDDMKDILFTE